VIGQQRIRLTLGVEIHRNGGETSAGEQAAEVSLMGAESRKARQQYHTGESPNLIRTGDIAAAVSASNRDSGGTVEDGIGALVGQDRQIDLVSDGQAG
jgi:hypothetical protein